VAAEHFTGLNKRRAFLQVALSAESSFAGTFKIKSFRSILLLRDLAN